MKTNLYCLLTIVGYSLITACTKNSSTDPATPPPPPVSERASEEWADFKTAMSTKLSALDAKIETFEAKAKSGTSQAKVEWAKRVAEMKATRSNLGKQLEELNETTKDKFLDLKMKLQHQYDTLENEIRKTTN